MKQPKRIHPLIAILMAIASFVIGMNVHLIMSKKDMAHQEAKMRHVLSKVADCAHIAPEEIELIMDI